LLRTGKKETARGDESDKKGRDNNENDIENKCELRRIPARFDINNVKENGQDTEQNHQPQGRLAKNLYPGVGLAPIFFCAIASHLEPQSKQEGW
jgi:hypothetical protein